MELEDRQGQLLLRLPVVGRDSPNDPGPPRDGGQRLIVVPPPWEAFYQASRIPAAVRVGDTLYVTGHTGESADGAFPEDVEEQVRGTFRNVTLTLAEAGMGWADVVELTSYHVGLRSQFPEPVFGVAAEFLTEPYPAWTAAGVTELFDPDAVIEISCVAVVPGSASWRRPARSV